MVDAEAEPIGIAIDWGEIVNIEVYRNNPALILSRN